MNRSNTSVLCSALAFTVTVGSFFLPTFVSVANGQSSMNMMSKMMMGGNGDNGTGDMMIQMMGRNMSRLPFEMGVLAMPLMCTTPGDIILGQFEVDADTEGNETQDMKMNEMIQQMMMSYNGSNGMNSSMTEADSQELQNAMNMNNMTDSEAELEHAMSMNICFPMMDEGMMKEMMGIMGWG